MMMKDVICTLSGGADHKTQLTRVITAIAIIVWSLLSLLAYQRNVAVAVGGGVQENGSGTMAAVTAKEGRVASRSTWRSLQPAPTTILDRCYQGRFNGYWDFEINRMRFFDPVCDKSLVTLVKLPEAKDPSIANSTNEFYHGHTDPALFDRLKDSCILLLGDSTDRQIIERVCPLWGTGESEEKIDIWMPAQGAERLGANQKLAAGFRCNVQDKFTLGQYQHYGVSEAPYWRVAHMYVKGPKNLAWSNTTETRVKDDMPKFFEHCATKGHDKFKVVVVQSYLWDLARQWLRGNTTVTTRPPDSMIVEWAQNVTTLVSWVREAVPDALIAWRFAGDLRPENGRDSQAMHDMNAAILALGNRLDVDFFTDYGAVLDSKLASVGNKRGRPFGTHPPKEPMTGYLNILMNALVAARDAQVEE